MGYPVFRVAQAGGLKASSTGSVFPPSSLDSLCSSESLLSFFLLKHTTTDFLHFDVLFFRLSSFHGLIQCQAQAGSHQIFSVNGYRLPARYPPNIVAQVKSA